MRYLHIVDSREPKRETGSTVDLAKCLIIDKEISFGRLGIGLPEYLLIERRHAGPLEGMAFYLNDNFDWVLGRDPDGCLVLVPQIR